MYLNENLNVLIHKNEMFVTYINNIFKLMQNDTFNDVYKICDIWS